MTDRDPASFTPADMLDPSLDGDTLRLLTAKRPDLWPQILEHPNTYPDLANFIRSKMPASAQPAATPEPAFTAAPASTPAAATPATPATPAAPATPAGPNAFQTAAQNINTDAALSATKGFFGSLFDTKFDHFVAPKLARVFYIIAIVLHVIAYLGLIIAAFQEDAGLGFAAIFVGALVILWDLILVRIVLEFLVSTVKTAENTARIR